MYKYNSNFLNKMFKFFFIYNSLIFNYCLNDFFYIYKNNKNNKNNYFLFLFKFFKKKKKKKKIKIRKFKFRRFRRFKFKKFKKFRKHLKIFRLKKTRKRKSLFLKKDFNFFFFYNFFNKIFLTKTFKITKNLTKFKSFYKNLLNPIIFSIFSIKLQKKPKTNKIHFKNCFFKINFLLKKKKYNRIFSFFNVKYKKFKNCFLFSFLSFKYNQFIKIFKFIQLYKKNKFFNLTNYIIIGVYKNYKKIFLFSFFLFSFILLNFFIKHFFKNTKKNLVKKKRKLKIKFFKRHFFFHFKLFKKKYSMSWKKRKPFLKKIFFKKKLPLIKSELYKILLVTFLKKKKFYKNTFLVSQTLHSFRKSFFLKNKTKNKTVYTNILKNKNVYNNTQISMSYNNFFPIYNSHYFLTKRFKIYLKSFFSKRFLTSMQFYIISFFESLFKKNFFIKLVNNNFYRFLFKKKKNFKIKKLNQIFIKNKLLVLSRINKFNLSEIIELIFYSFYHKDLYILKNWFLRNFSTVHYKIQRKFLLFFRILITDVFQTYKYLFGISGFYFLLKGKVGVTSNAKKRKVFFRVGPLNKSSKNQKIDFQQGIVKASSGTSGLLMILTYM